MLRSDKEIVFTLITIPSLTHNHPKYIKKKYLIANSRYNQSGNPIIELKISSPSQTASTIMRFTDLETFPKYGLTIANRTAN